MLCVYVSCIVLVQTSTSSRSALKATTAQEVKQTVMMMSVMMSVKTQTPDTFDFHKTLDGNVTAVDLTRRTS